MRARSLALSSLVCFELKVQQPPPYSLMMTARRNIKENERGCLCSSDKLHSLIANPALCKYAVGTHTLLAHQGRQLYNPGRRYLSGCDKISTIETSKVLTFAHLSALIPYFAMLLGYEIWARAKICINVVPGLRRRRRNL
jgi:hypothetical protein